MPDRSHITAVFLGSTPFIFLNFSLPVYADDLGLTPLVIGGTYAVFTLTMLVVRPWVGLGLDRYGRRPFFSAAFVFYVLAMALFSQVDGAAGFYAARFLQGIGASFMWVSARTIVADIEAEQVGEGMGRLITGSVRGSMLGGMYGFTLLGFMPLASAWVWAFAGYSLLALLALIWSWLKVAETRPHSLAPTQVKLNLREMLQDHELAKAFALVFLSGFAAALIEPIYLLYLKNKFDIGVLQLAIVFLPAGIVFAIVPRYAGRWSDRFGRPRTIAVGLIFAAATTVALPFWPMLLGVALTYILFSVGTAIAGPAIDAMVADRAQPAQRGRVMGGKEAFQGLGAALGPLVGTGLYQYAGQVTPFLLNGVVMVCAVVFVLTALRTPART